MSLEEFILTNEKPIRMGFFFGVLMIMALWEIAAPRRKLTVSKTLRWTNNIGLVFFQFIYSADTVSGRCRRCRHRCERAGPGVI